MHWELPSKTLYISDRNYTYDYGSVQHYENYLFDLGNLPVELLRVNGSRNFKITLRFRNDKILDKDYLIELNDDYEFVFSTVKIYELRLVERGETFASDVKTLMFRGMAGQPYDITRREFKIDCHNILLAKRNRLPLHVINTDDYPSADPDDIGKYCNQIVGSIDHVPCPCVESGAVDNLESDITDSQTSIELSDASEFASSGTIGIDEEEITYTGKSSNTLTGCTRGANETTALAHAEGSPVWEIKTRFVYQVADHPVKSIGDIYVEGLRVTSIATKYTGQTGDELTGYEGEAVFTVPSKLTSQQAVDLLINDGMTINDAIAVVDTIDVNDGISVSDTIGVSDPGHSHGPEVTEYIIEWKFEWVDEHNPEVQDDEAIIDGNWLTSAEWIDADAVAWPRLHNWTEREYGGTPTHVRVSIDVTNSHDTGTMVFAFAGASVQRSTPGTSQSDWVALGSSYDTWAKLSDAHGEAYQTGPTVVNARVTEVKVEIKYNPHGTSSDEASVSKTGGATKSGSATKTGSATKSGTVTREGVISLIGNSVADVRIGKTVTANVDGYRDDGSGTYTGTPDALIERPDHFLKYLLAGLLGESADDIGSSFAASGTYYGSTYKFGFILHEVAREADNLVQALAFQCRSKFVEWRGKFELIYQGSAPGVTRTFNDDEILEEPVFGFTREIDIRNKVFAKYNRDYRQTGENAYRGIEKDNDATSISKHGERPETIELSVCRSQAMAADWVSWYLDQVKDLWHTLNLIVPWVGKLIGAGETFGLIWDIFDGLSWDLVNVEVDHAHERVRLQGQEWPT